MNDQNNIEVTTKEETAVIKNDVWILLIILVLLAIFLPVIVNALIKTNWGIFDTAADAGNPDWISFWGSYLGGLIGGIATIAALFFTVKNFNQQMIEQKSIGNIEAKRFNEQINKLQDQIDKYSKQIHVLENINAQNKELFNRDIDFRTKQLEQERTEVVKKDKERNRLSIYPACDVFIYDTDMRKEICCFKNIGDHACVDIRIILENIEFYVGTMGKGENIDICVNGLTYDFGERNTIDVIMKDIKGNEYKRVMEFRMSENRVNTNGFIEPFYYFTMIQEEYIETNIKY